MQMTRLATLIATGMLVAACGGGAGEPDAPAVATGGGTPPVGTSPGGTPPGGTDAGAPVVKGVVATGAALAGAAVKAYDSRGVEVGSGTTGADGGFSVTLTQTGVAPYVLLAEKDEIRLAAIFTASADGNVNVTPISDAVVSLLYTQGSDVLALLQAGTAAPTAAAVASKQEMLRAALQPLLAAVGVRSDPFTGALTTNGTNLDKVLDSLTVAKSLDKDGTARVELTFKTATDPVNASADNPTITLSNTSDLQAVTAQAAAVSISASDLPPDSAGALYQDFIDRLNACYAEPVETRSDRSANLLSPVCRGLFVDADPARYLHGGARVRAGGAFGGMFTYGGSVVFKALTRAYLVQDLAGARSPDGKGRAIVSTSWTNTDGNRENIALYVTRYVLDGKEVLGASGDQNAYGFFVNSHNQKREFPLRDGADLDYVQGNWLIAVNDVVAAGVSAIDFVRVTSPSGKLIVMAPGLGGAQRDLQICKRGEVVQDPARGLIPALTDSGAFYCSGSKAITVTERFVSDADTRLPSQTITNAGIIRPLKQVGREFVPYTPGDEEVSTWKSMGLWRAEYHFRDARPVLVQRTWSAARPMTTAELLGPSGPERQVGRLTNVDAIKALKTASVLTPCHPTDTACIPAQSPVPAPATGGFPMTWTAGSVPITSLWVSGSLNGKLYAADPATAAFKTWVSSNDNVSAGSPPVTRSSARWDDQRTVASSTTSMQVFCSRQSLADKHCADAVGSGQVGGYNPYTWMSYSELWGKDAEQRTLMRAYNWYRPVIASQ